MTVGLPNKPPLCAVEVVLLLLVLPNKPPLDEFEAGLVLFPNRPLFGTTDPVELLPNKPVEPVEFVMEPLFANKLPVFLEVVLVAPPNKPPDDCAGLFPNKELLAGC